MNINQLHLFLDKYYKESKLLSDLSLICNDYNDFDINVDQETIEQLVTEYNNIKQPKVSCAIITFNEEKRIKKCLESVRKKFDELLVIDSGSRDNTIHIINQYFPNTKVYIEPWENDFSLQRNKAIQYATTDWIFFIDADNYIENTENDCIKRVAQIVSYLKIQGVVSPYITEHDNSFSVDNRKMFKISDKISFFGRVHEEPLNENKEIPLNIVANIHVYHDGYDPKKYNMTEKTIRNLKLVKQMIDEDSKNPKWQYFYARAMYILNEDKQIIKASLLRGMELYKTWTDKRYFANLLSYLCRISLETQDFINLKRYTALLNEQTNKCSDIDYYNAVILFTTLQSKLKGLDNILDQNENKYIEENYFSFINESHDHIRTLHIQIKLMLGEYQQILNLVNDIKTEEIKNHIKKEISILSLLKQHSYIDKSK
ncbi:SunS family peptide S-glycosyltransferase [Bacillus thuringiensis]|uniref:SunS family peptide S-glycosyltransferase n=1 Tax=Bacillus thuringiensis TaxID=1428 RepID=A0A9X7BIQ4_BACTU|nr:SunS family peptide S-glycosyltransferase [Bacillus thuringiensis]PFV26277.1 SunS family peptide S-glycosyltransferase [Bacillus thuringiensis]